MSKKKRKQKNTLAEFKREMEVDEEFKGQKIQLHERGEKMSEILGLFIEPYIEYTTNYHAYNNLVATAVVAWNAALLDAKHQRQFLNDAKKSMTIDPTTQKDLLAIVSEMIARKKLLFAANRRFIVNYKVIDTGRNYQLIIVSTPGNPPPTEAEEETQKSSINTSVKKLLDAVFGK